jgi:hypothetical protein
MLRKRILTASIMGLLATLPMIRTSTNAAQDTIDVSSPLHDVFYGETVMPITQVSDGNGGQVFVTRIPVPNYDQATLVWQLSFDPVPPADPGFIQRDVCAAIDQLSSNDGLSQIQTAVESGALTSLNVRFVDDVGGSAAFIGRQSPSPAPISGLDRAGAERLLINPVQNLTGDNVVSAVALVSAPSLNLTDIPMFLDGRIESAYDRKDIQENTLLQQKTKQQINQQQQQQIRWENCDARLGCATPTLGAFCPTIRTMTEYYIICRGQITAGPYSTPPLSVGVGCQVQRSGRSVQFPGQCNFVQERVGLFRCRQRCACT